jgi:carbamoyltransferase
MEFGPRALGNRSILADPRPVENREIINGMVKMREAYRPFAPAVLEEFANDYYDLPAEMPEMPYMIYVVDVEEKAQQVLGAVTHTDGTARIQTVSRKTNPKFWQLIHDFQQRTGIPILLNTSFNNNAEPIVSSANNAVVCFLTTKIQYLVIGDYLIKKLETDSRSYLELYPAMPQYVILEKVIKCRKGALVHEFSLRCNYSEKYTTPIADSMFDVLSRADGSRSLGELVALADIKDEQVEEVITSILDLWSRRLIVMQPSSIRIEAHVNGYTRV